MSIFEDILAGRLPGEIIYQDDRVAVIMDIVPMNPGHCLVVPRRAARGLQQLDAEDGERMFRVAQSVATALRQAISGCLGINLFLADGRVAGQEVMHAHLHVIPRLEGDGIRLARKRAGVVEREAQATAVVAARLRAALDRL